MNNRELAIGVYNHPLIQEILKRKIAEPSLINQLIVEEVMMEDELEEARSRLATSALSGIKRDLRNAKNNDKLDAFVKKYEGPLEQGNIPYKRWSEITDEEERKQILGFVKNTLEGIKKSQGDKTPTGDTELSDVMKKLIAAINKEPEAYERILDNNKKGKYNPPLTDEEEAQLKQAYEKKITAPNSISTLIGDLIEKKLAEKIAPKLQPLLRKLPVIGQGVDYVTSIANMFGS